MVNYSTGWQLLADSFFSEFRVLGNLPATGYIALDIVDTIRTNAPQILSI